MGDEQFGLAYEDASASLDEESAVEEESSNARHASKTNNDTIPLPPKQIAANRKSLHPKKTRVSTLPTSVCVGARPRYSFESQSEDDVGVDANVPTNRPFTRLVVEDAKLQHLCNDAEAWPDPSCILPSSIVPLRVWHGPALKHAWKWFVMVRGNGAKESSGQGCLYAMKSDVYKSVQALWRSGAASMSSTERHILTQLNAKLPPKENSANFKPEESNMKKLLSERAKKAENGTAVAKKRKRSDEAPAAAVENADADPHEDKQPPTKSRKSEHQEQQVELAAAPAADDPPPPNEAPAACAVRHEWPTWVVEFEKGSRTARIELASDAEQATTVVCLPRKMAETVFSASQMQLWFPEPSR